MTEHPEFAGFMFVPVVDRDNLSITVANIVTRITAKQTQVMGLPENSESKKQLEREIFGLQLILESLQIEFAKKELRVIQSNLEHGSQEWTAIEHQIREVDSTHVMALQRIITDGAGASKQVQQLLRQPELLERFKL